MLYITTSCIEKLNPSLSNTKGYFFKTFFSLTYYLGIKNYKYVDKYTEPSQQFKYLLFHYGLGK